MTPRDGATGLVTCLALVLLGCTMPGSSPETPADSTRVEVHRAGSTTVFEGPDREVVAGQLRQLLESCNVDSVRYGSIFAEADSDAWSRVLSGDRLEVAYPSPQSIAWHGGRADFGELVLELREGNYPGVFVGRGPMGVTQLTKCDGMKTFELVCLPELAPLLPATYAHGCHLVPTR